MEINREKIIKKYIKNEKAQYSAGQGGMMRGPGGGRGGNAYGGKPGNAKETIKRIFRYMKADKLRIAAVILCVIISNIANLAGTYMLRPIINMIVDKEISASERKSTLLIRIIMMICFYAAAVVASYLQQRCMTDVSQRAITQIRSDLYGKLQRLPLKYHDSNVTGDLMSRFTNDTDAMGEMINNTLVQLISGIAAITGTLFLMFVTNIWLTIVLIVTMPLLTLSGGAIAKRSRKYYSGQQAALGAVNGYIEEMVTGCKVVKVFCHEERAEGEFGILSDELRKNQVNAQFFGGIMGPVLGNMSQVTFAITCSVGGIFCIISKFDIGGLAVFAKYARDFSRPINELSMQINTIFSALAGAERVFNVMDMEPERDMEQTIYTIAGNEEYAAHAEQAAQAVHAANAEHAAQVAHVEHAAHEAASYDNESMKNILKIEGLVKLSNVTFGYLPEKTVLKNITVEARPGQKIAFVGSTGAGKTTITNLINRFYEVWQGSITIDGINVKDIKLDSLRKNVAVVLQDTHLFTGTIMENIRYGRLDATDEEVITAAKVASAHSFIKRLENGYDTVIDGDGSNLSQGQRQLLNIARAAISKAPVLILDEATSSVDTRTEKHIEHGMERLMKNRTTFVIAHRLSTVRNADSIIVLEHGEIVEMGTHEELLLNGGRYYELYTGKAELD